MNAKTVSLSSIFCSVLLVTSAVTVSGEAIDAGREAFYDGNYQQAEPYFLENLRDPELKEEALMYLSRIALETGDTDRAVKHVEQLLVIAPSNVEAVILSADIYCEQAQNSSIFRALRLARRCIALYEEAIELDSKSIEALAAAARFYLHAPSVAGGSTKKGREFLDQLTKLSPEHGASVTVEWLEKDGERNAAVELADQLFEKGFQFPQNQYEIARYYKELMVYEKARSLFEDLLRRDKTRDNRWVVNDSLLQLGEIYIAEGEDVMKGIELIEAYKQANSNSHDVHYFWSSWSLANAYRVVGQHEKYQALVSDIQEQDYSRDKDFAKEFESELKKR